MKRIHILGVTLVIVLVGAGLWYWLSNIPSVDQDRTIVLVSPIPVEYGYWEIPYAQDAGYFDEYNLNVSIVTVRSSSEMVQAVVSGEADFFTGTGDAVRAQLAGGSQLRIIYVNSLAGFSLIGRPGINTVQDIETMAHYVGRGSEADILCDFLMPDNGMTLGEDYDEVFVSIDGLVPAFQNDEFDAVSAGSIGFTLLNMGGTHLVKFADAFPQILMSGLTCDESRIEQKFEAYKDFIKALYRSQTYLMEHRDEAIEYGINTLGLEPDYAEWIYDYGFTNEYGAPYKITPGMPLDDIEYSMKLNAEWLEKEEITVADMVDTRLWDQAKQELGV